MEFLGLATGTGSVDVTVRNGAFEMAFDLTIDVGPFSLQAHRRRRHLRRRHALGHRAAPRRLARREPLRDRQDQRDRRTAAQHLRHRPRARRRLDRGEVLPARALGPDQAARGHLARRRVRDPDRRRPRQRRVRQHRRAFDLGPGEWVIDVNASADFFGLASMGVRGWIDSIGEFDIQLRARLVLGTTTSVWSASSRSGCSSTRATPPAVRTTTSTSTSPPASTRASSASRSRVSA